MNKEKLIKAIEQAEKEQEGLFVKRVLELYQMSNTKDNNPSKIKEGKSSALNDFLNNLKKEGERNPYQFTEEEIEERKKNPNIRTLEEQKEIREKLLLSKSLHGILKDNIEEGLNLILINGVVLKRVEEDNTIYGFDKRNYDYQVGF